MKPSVLFVFAALVGGGALAHPPAATATPTAPAPRGAFTGTDFSGVYDCAGDDRQEGGYTGTVTLKLVREQSHGAYGAYTFTLEVPGYGTYPGHGAAQGRHMAIYFANTDPSTRDFGTGIATFSRAKAGRWSFTKYYYEPEFKGGNYGLETCLGR
ncbi:MAG TPA: hypothetical protein VJ548_07790 [Azospira sp.]|nr:hypothetical protein [Azospira sp.]